MPIYEPTTTEEVAVDSYCTTGRIRVANAYTVVRPVFSSSALGGPPKFTLQPMSGSVAEGNAYVLMVAAQGLQPITYQWRFAGVPMAGQTNPILTLTNVLRQDSGDYDCIATNDAGSTASDKATLTVTPPANVLPIYLGNAGQTSLVSYTAEQIKALEQTAPQLNPVERSQVTGVYEISAPSSGLNEYRIIAFPETFITGSVSFASAGGSLPMSVVQSGLNVDGVMFKVYRTVGRSSGDFTMAGHTEIMATVH